jgi:hypothetical protein
VLFFAAIPFLAFAQMSKLPQRIELVTVESEIGASEEVLEVFYVPQDDGTKQYYFTVGHLGFGDEVFQLVFDPVFELFIPIGTSVAEAQENLEKIQEMFKKPIGTAIEKQGCLAFGFPDDKLEPVKVAFEKSIMGKVLSFSVERQGYIRATYITKSQFNSLVRGVKVYRKIHPKEE